MISSINVKQSAANANIPLAPIFSYKNSAISVRFIDVPKKIGDWKITEVFLNVHFPNNEVASKKCVLIAGAWVATVNGAKAVGSVDEGYWVSANGIDENGEPVENYILGKGQLFITDADGNIQPGVTNYYLHLLDEKTNSPKKGDVVYEGEGWQYFDGKTWKAFGTTDYTDQFASKLDAEVDNVPFTGNTTIAHGDTVDFPRAYSISVSYTEGRATNADLVVDGVNYPLIFSSNIDEVGDSNRVDLNNFGSIQQYVVLTKVSDSEISVTIHSVYNTVDIPQDIGVIKIEGYSQSKNYKSLAQSIETYTYNKSTIDQKLSEAGKVKTVNGQEPDEDGNIEIEIQHGDFLPLSGG